MRTKLTVAALAVFGLVLAGAPAFAHEVRVTIPFSFTAMGKALPAGVYEIGEQSSDVLKLESVSNPALQVELPVLERLAAGRAPRNARVEFTKIGRRDVLARIWIDGDTGYVVALPTR